MDQSISSSQLKARCSEIVARVEEKRETVIVTRRGKAVAKIVPIACDAPDLFGFARGAIKVSGDLIEPVGAEWEAAE